MNSPDGLHLETNPPKPAVDQARRIEAQTHVDAAAVGPDQGVAEAEGPAGRGKEGPEAVGPGHPVAEGVADKAAQAEPEAIEAEPVLNVEDEPAARLEDPIKLPQGGLGVLDESKYAAAADDAVGTPVRHG